MHLCSTAPARALTYRLVTAGLLAALTAAPLGGRPAAAAELPPAAKRIDVGPVPPDLLPVVVEDPQTPVTRTLSPTAAAAALERDWVFQADGYPTAQRARREIGWARELAERLSRHAAAPDVGAELRALSDLEHRYAGLDPKRAARTGALPDGQRAGWSFEPDAAGFTAADSPQAHTSLLLGRAEPAPGVFGDGLLLNGRACLNLGAELSAVAGGSYTLCAWIRTRSPTGDLLGNGAAAGCVLLQTYQGKAKAHHWSTTAAHVLTGQTDVTDGRWHHLAQVVSDSRLALFVDGRLDGELPLQGPTAPTTAPLLLGARSLADTSWRFAGCVDEVGIYGRALTPAEIAQVHQEGAAQVSLAADPDASEFYLAVRQIKRRLLFRNPVVDFSQVVLIDQPYPSGLAWQHQAIHRLGHRAVPGGRLLLLDGLDPAGLVRQLYPPQPGSFWKPEVSFDGRRLVFSYKAHAEKSFHLYEMNLDGSGVRQLTTGDYDDIDPIYLPDGRLAFTTTRGNSYVRCGPFIYSYVLARCDADGSNLHLISTNNEPDFVPALLPDGRLIYSRWEYTDKALWRVQSLWTTHTDGTGTAAYWGNQSVWPDHLAEPRPIPGSQRVMFAGVGHHDWFSGSIGILDRSQGFNFPAGLTKVTADLAWPECSPPPLDAAESSRYHAAGAYTGYLGAYPLSETDFLVSARGEEGKFRLYLMDTDGNRELIWEGAHHAWYAIPVRPRPLPPTRPDSVIWPATSPTRQANAPGEFYSADVLQGVPDLPREQVRYLRVIQQDAKTYSTWMKTFRHSGPPVSVVQEETVKRIVSVVPVEADGSVHFAAPTGQSVYFQLLDEHYRALQTMRSFTGLMPGERRGCVGCHEQHSTTAAGPRRATAPARAPTPLSPPPWGTASISFERFVQPVLDRACGTCHQGDGEGRKTLDLTLRPGVDVFKEPYLTLVGQAAWAVGAPGAGPDSPGYGAASPIPVETLDPTMNDPRGLATLRPLAYLSPRSRLIDIAMSDKHHGVKVDPEDRQRLIAWVDACSPYMGDVELRALGDPWFEGIEKLPIRPRVQTAPEVARP
jgi:hypothetical protein